MLFRTRFYGFEPPKPFVVFIEREFCIKGMQEMFEHTEEEESEAGYWPCGIYQYIKNNTFFLTVTPIAASALSTMYYSSIIKMADLSEVLPCGDVGSSELKTSTVTLILSKELKQEMVKILETSSFPSPAECKEILVNCVLLSNMPWKHKRLRNLPYSLLRGQF